MHIYIILTIKSNFTKMISQYRYDSGYFMFRSAPQGEVSAVMGGLFPNTVFIFRAFVATPRALSYLCIFSSFYLALNLILPGSE